MFHLDKSPRAASTASCATKFCQPPMITSSDSGSAGSSLGPTHAPEAPPHARLLRISFCMLAITSFILPNSISTLLVLVLFSHTTFSI